MPISQEKFDFKFGEVSLRQYASLGVSKCYEVAAQTAKLATHIQAIYVGGHQLNYVNIKCIWQMLEYKMFFNLEKNVFNAWC